MNKQMTRKLSIWCKKRGRLLFPIVLVLLFTAALGIPDAGTDEPKDTNTSRTAAENKGSAADTNSNGSQPSQENSADTEKQGDSQNTQTVEQKSFKDYFKDSLFIGDSITEGLSSYGLVEESNVLASKGFTVSKMGSEVDKVVKAKPQKIFILLGANDILYGMSSQKFALSYGELVQSIKDRVPGAKIYIQSIFPVAAKVETQKPMMSNNRIDEFNNAIKEMANEKGVKFLYTASLFKDEKGRMREECSSDGIHLNYKSYSAWISYLMNNAK